MPKSDIISAAEEIVREETKKRMGRSLDPFGRQKALRVEHAEITAERYVDTMGDVAGHTEFFAS